MAKKVARKRKTKKLSQIYGFDPSKVDFVDVDLFDDLPLFVDPILFWRSPHPEHHAVHAQLISFFDNAISLVKQGNEERVRRSFIFPEPENLLGVSRKGHAGKGLNVELGGKLYQGVLGVPDILEKGLSFLNELQLVVPHVGPDLVSDMTVNITKSYFIEYTQANCQKHNIPMELVSISVFLESEGVWDDVQVELPLHPKTKEGFLLTPRAVVRRKDLALNYKSAYQNYLRNFFRLRVESGLAALGKTPKVTWKAVEKAFPKTKAVVAEAIIENPKFRHQLIEGVGRDLQGRGMQITREHLQDLEPGPPIVYGAVKDIASAIREGELKYELSSLVDTIGGESGITSESRLPMHFVNGVIQKVSDSVVLILGAYDDKQADPFERIVAELDQDYEPCIIRDMPDLHSVNPRQKLFTYAVLSRFIIVLDFGASGHLSEIELLKDLTKPVILISKDEKGASYMTAGLDFSHTYFKRFTLSEFDSLEKALANGVEWANSLITTTKNLNKRSLPWLAESID
ncbi:MAG: hypothetical protein EOP05_02800 [Proteobacteria bacterium]|nr:MAG: hypothetical protein EOP05_02800 [Pseudomonadota bacterium]